MFESIKKKVIDFCKWIISEIKDWHTFVIFVVVICLMYSPVWGGYLFHYLFNNPVGSIVATSYMLFWAGPFTPFFPLCIAITLGIVKIYRSLFESNQSDNNFLGNNLKQLREKNELTIEEASSKLHIKPNKLVFIENGKVKPSIHTLIYLSNIYSSNLKVIFGLDERISNETLVMVCTEYTLNCKKSFNRKIGLSLILLAILLTIITIIPSKGIVVIGCLILSVCLSFGAGLFLIGVIESNNV